ncbi:40s ribosomal protein s5-1 [Hordeum vulgare]|nr:40s ribosomal protein s5-1 [Hordeum vulgare]
METRLEAMEQQVFKCQGMVERGLDANHMMITEFTNKHRIDANDIGKHLSTLYDGIDQLQAQIYDVQNQNYEVSITIGLVDWAFSAGSHRCSRTSGHSTSWWDPSHGRPCIDLHNHHGGCLFFWAAQLVGFHGSQWWFPIISRLT